MRGQIRKQYMHESFMKVLHMLPKLNTEISDPINFFWVIFDLFRTR